MGQYGCYVDVIWNIVEECDVLWMICGTLSRNVHALWRNVDVMWKLHLHISQFDQVLSPLLSVILKYTILDALWTFHISTLYSFLSFTSSRVKLIVGGGGA